MPNHVTTEITGPQRALASLLDDGGTVNFEHLVPPPPNIETGNCGHSLYGPTADPTATGDGTVCWYAWNAQNWGTKWNAYDSEVTEGKVRFDTAWSHPFPVIRALVEKHPNETFEVKYADEDLGSNLGHYIIKDGGATVEMVDIEDALEFAAQIKYGQSYQSLREEWGEDEEGED